MGLEGHGQVRLGLGDEAAHKWPTWYAAMASSIAPMAVLGICTSVALTSTRLMRQTQRADYGLAVPLYSTSCQKREKAVTTSEITKLD